MPESAADIAKYAGLSASQVAALRVLERHPDRGLTGKEVGGEMGLSGPFHMLRLARDLSVLTERGKVRRKKMGGLAYFQVVDQSISNPVEVAAESRMTPPSE